MATVRFSRVARADIARILAASEARWGTEGRRRYEALLAAAVRQLASSPDGLLTRHRNELAEGIRSFHLRHTSVEARNRVRAPVHVIYYKVSRHDEIKVVAVLHDRMDPARHLRGEESAS